MFAQKCHSPIALAFPGGNGAPGGAGPMTVSPHFLDVPGGFVPPLLTIRSASLLESIARWPRVEVLLGLKRSVACSPLRMGVRIREG